ncbi:MAG: ribonuclease domain-containing protein [Niabella sp.]
MKNKSLSVLMAIVLLVLLGAVACNGCGQKTSPQASEKTSSRTADNSSQKIDKLTSEKVVVPYLKINGKLPDYYVTKKEALEKGWVAANGNLCNVLPGKAIGGDVFSNREGNLPRKQGRRWYEADLNYNCGLRNADRVLFSSDGLVYVTYDHYKTFQQR